MRGVDGALCVFLLAHRDRQCVVELRALDRQRFRALRDFVGLADRALTVVLDPAHAVLQRAQLPLHALHPRARVGERTACIVLCLLMAQELSVCRSQLRCDAPELRRGGLTLRGDLGARLLARARLCFGTLAPRGRIALPLLGHSHLATNTLHLLPLCVHEARELVALCLGCRARIVRPLARQLGVRDRLLGSRKVFA